MKDAPCRPCRNRKLPSRKRQKLNPAASCNGINTLSDDLLIIILSFLTLKEAVSTSVLSRRWRYLWRFTSGSLDFQLHYTGDVGKPDPGTQIRRATVTEFVTLVNQVLKLHQAPSVHKFIVRYRGSTYEDTPNICISNWIHYAMQMDVRCFELDFRQGLDFRDLDQFLLTSRAAIGKPTKDHSGISSLTSLTLGNVSQITPEMIEYLLSNSPHLEHLCLKNLQGVQNLRIAGPCLKSLIINHCYYLKILTISSANLLYFEIDNGFMNCTFIKFENTPSLLELKVGGMMCSYFLHGPRLPTKFPNQLEKLILHMCYEAIHLSMDYICPSREYALPQLQHLKHLELELTVSDYVSLLYFVSLTKACPLLSQFVLKFIYRKKTKCKQSKTVYGGEVAQVYRALHHHQCLRVVKLTDFACYRSEFRFVLSLLQVAKALRKLIIAPGPGHLGTKRIATVRERCKQLKANLPPGAELTILYFPPPRGGKMDKWLINGFS